MSGRAAWAFAGPPGHEGLSPAAGNQALFLYAYVAAGALLSSQIVGAPSPRSLNPPAVFELEEASAFPQAMWSRFPNYVGGA